jgi:hypothetical protein
LLLPLRGKSGPRPYLLTGAATAHWEGSVFADIFDDAEHDPVELCSRRLQRKKQEFAWDEALRGASDSFPTVVPQDIQTEVVSRAPAGDWELRAVEVRVSNQAFVPFGGGWPWGQRPAEASRPVPPLTSGNQVDPATLPENIELMQQLDEQLAQSDEAPDEY